MIYYIITDNPYLIIKYTNYQVENNPFIEVVFVIIHPNFSNAHRVFAPDIPFPTDRVPLPEDMTYM